MKHNLHKHSCASLQPKLSLSLADKNTNVVFPAMNLKILVSYAQCTSSCLRNCNSQFILMKTHENALSLHSRQGKYHVLKNDKLIQKVNNKVILKQEYSHEPNPLCKLESQMKRSQLVGKNKLGMLHSILNHIKIRILPKCRNQKKNSRIKSNEIGLRVMK